MTNFYHCCKFGVWNWSPLPVGLIHGEYRMFTKPRILLISLLCISGRALSIWRLSCCAHTMKAFIGRLICCGPLSDKLGSLLCSLLIANPLPWNVLPAKKKDWSGKALLFQFISLGEQCLPARFASIPWKPWTTVWLGPQCWQNCLYFWVKTIKNVMSKIASSARLGWLN